MRAAQVPGMGSYEVSESSLMLKKKNQVSYVLRSNIFSSYLPTLPALPSSQVRPMWGATTGPRVTPGGKFMASQRGSALDHTLLEAAHKPG